VSERHSKITRSTRETDVAVELTLDGGPADIATGVGFFDHMLEHVAKHGRLGLSIHASGDRQVDDHHTVEDVGITLGQTLKQALGQKTGIERFGFASVPMDEALARVSLDLSGRAALVFDATFSAGDGKIGQFDTQLIREFFRALSSSGAFNCHIEVPRGDNDHHIAEAIFKAFALALRQAAQVTGEEIPSTKGTL
jgi:imidazoleglycerol-phosphate dehydratase